MIVILDVWSGDRLLLIIIFNVIRILSSAFLIYERLVFTLYYINDCCRFSILLHLQPIDLTYFIIYRLRQRFAVFFVCYCENVYYIMWWQAMAILYICIFRIMTGNMYANMYVLLMWLTFLWNQHNIILSRREIYSILCFVCRIFIDLFSAFETENTVDCVVEDLNLSSTSLRM